MARRRGNCVLCIGNDPVNLNLRCSLLKEHGWNVLSAGSGHEGVIRFSQEQQVDAVIVDLNDGGAEAALITGELKRLRKEIPVIILLTAGKALANGVTQQADAAVEKSKEALTLIAALRALLPAQ